MILLHHKTLVSVETSENSLAQTLWLKKKEKRCDDTNLTNTGLHFKTSSKNLRTLTYLFFFFMYNV